MEPIVLARQVEENLGEIVRYLNKENSTAAPKVACIADYISCRWRRILAWADLSSSEVQLFASCRHSLQRINMPFDDPIDKGLEIATVVQGRRDGIGLVIRGER